MNPGDWIALAAIIVPIAYTRWVAVRSKKAESKAEERADREAIALQAIAKNAEGADRRAALAQQTADDMQRSFTEMAESLKEIAKSQQTRGVGSRATVEKLAPRWNIEHAGGQRFVLRNVGSVTATNVKVYTSNGALRVERSGDVSVAPAEGIFLLDESDYDSGPIEPSISVSCDEIGTVHVPVVGG